MSPSQRQQLRPSLFIQLTEKDGADAQLFTETGCPPWTPTLAYWTSPRARLPMFTGPLVSEQIHSNIQAHE